MYDIILFDLDGTLSDSGPGIMHSGRYARAKFGINGERAEALRRFVGPPMIPASMRFTAEIRSARDAARMQTAAASVTVRTRCGYTKTDPIPVRLSSKVSPLSRIRTEA